MNNKTQSGFGVVEIIIAVLVVAALAYGGYRLYGHFSKPAATSNTNSSQVTTTPTDPNAGYVVIKEWGVRFKPVSGLGELKYALRNSDSTVVFSTQQLIAADAHCDAQNSSYSGIGSITRTTTGSAAPFGGTLLTTVNGYDYYYEGAGQASCITDPNNLAGKTLLQTTDTEFSDSIKSLEAAK
ncbi:MAG TPA: hypothetical protein VNG90_02170 [Candidatus Acidoferrum sp.]|nr:hypothetical protein [Candidatus Acidoferrum sp.]